MTNYEPTCPCCGSNHTATNAIGSPRAITSWTYANGRPMSEKNKALLQELILALPKDPDSCGR